MYTFVLTMFDIRLAEKQAGSYGNDESILIQSLFLEREIIIKSKPVFSIPETGEIIGR